MVSSANLLDAPLLLTGWRKTICFLIGADDPGGASLNQKDNNKMEKTSSPTPDFVTQSDQFLEQMQSNKFRLDDAVAHLDSIHRKLLGNSPLDNPAKAEATEETTPALTSKMRDMCNDYAQALDSVHDLIQGLKEFI